MYKLLTYLSTIIFLSSCTIPQKSEALESSISNGGSEQASDKAVSLTMDWQPNRVTQHYRLIDIELIQSDVSVQYAMEGRYLQSVTRHEDGLLITQSELSIKHADISSAGLHLSQTQAVLMRLMPEMLFSIPDHILTPEGNFVRFVGFDKFKESKLNKLSEEVATTNKKSGSTLKLVNEIIAQSTNVGAYRKQIEDEMANFTEWEGKVLTMGQPSSGASSITTTWLHLLEEPVQQAHGYYSYHGLVECQVDVSTNRTCADLRFNSSNDGFSTEVQLVALPDSLIPYRHVITWTLGERGRVILKHTIIDND